MKKEQITYDVFLNTAKKMLEAGDRITIRGIHAQIGGSFGKISAYLKQYEQERARMAASQLTELSENLRHAIFAEIGKAVDETKSALEKQIIQLDEQLSETNEHLENQDAVITQQKTEIESAKEQLSLSKKTQDDLTNELKSLDGRLEQCQKEKMDAITNAIKYKSLLEHIEKNNSEMKTQIKELQEKLGAAIKEKHGVEKALAVVEEKLKIR